jgi:hypothetical protein
MNKVSDTTNAYQYTAALPNVAFSASTHIRGTTPLSVSGSPMYDRAAKSLEGLNISQYSTLYEDAQYTPQISPFPAAVKWQHPQHPMTPWNQE